MGGGITLNRSSDKPLEPILNQVIAEMRASWPDRVIDARFSLPEPVDCDRSRIGRVLSNLLGNALSYGSAQDPVRVRATDDGATFDLFAACAALAFLLLIVWPAYEYAQEETFITTPALGLNNAWRAAALPSGIALMAAFAFTSERKLVPSTV